MIPVPKVRKVPRCYQCAGEHELILGDGPVVCRSCVRICVRLAVVGAMSVNDDGTVNE